MTRSFNFSAGPAALPEAVLERVQRDLLDFDGHGLSVMEMSHRSPEFLEIASRAERSLRDLLAIPDDFAVLFLQGGATLQFAMLTLNLAGETDAVDYVHTGHWSKKAVSAATGLADLRVVADTSAGSYRSIPERDRWRTRSDANYLHYTPNETIAGVEFHWIPEAGDVPLVADVSSTLLSRPLDVSRFGMLYAGAQKNIGPAGLTMVIIRRELLGHARKGTPAILDYAEHDKARSMLNTPPTFAWYMAGLVFDWIAEQGGLEAMGSRNRSKAEALYAKIDGSGFYSNPVEMASRSLMNVPFMLDAPELDQRFMDEASEAGLTNLQGHRSVGGMRASIYNAMPDQGVQALIGFMSDFESRLG